MDKEQELLSELKKLAVLYWGEKYGGKFLGSVEFGDLPGFCIYALKSLGYIKLPEGIEEEILKPLDKI